MLYTLITSCILFLMINYTSGDSSCYAPPLIYGMVCQGDGVIGSPGTRVGYTIKQVNNVGTLLCCKARGYQVIISDQVGHDSPQWKSKRRDEQTAYRCTRNTKVIVFSAYNYPLWVKNRKENNKVKNLVRFNSIRRISWGLSSKTLWLSGIILVCSF